MPGKNVSLPVLPANRPMRLTPTDLLTVTLAVDRQRNGSAVPSRWKARRHFEIVAASR